VRTQQNKPESCEIFNILEKYASNILFLVFQINIDEYIIIMLADDKFNIFI